MAIPDPLQKLRAVTLQTAADTLGISKRTLHRLIAAGEFPKPIKVGASTRVLVEDIVAFIQLQRQKAAV